MTENSNRFAWIPFYEELARKLLAYKDKARRGELLTSLQNALQSKMKELPKSVIGRDLSDIDPFTVLGLFNTQDESKESEREARVKIAGAIKEWLKMEENVPTDFCGVPTSLRATFYKKGDEKNFSGQSVTKNIDRLWKLFEVAMATSIDKTDFADAYDDALKIHGLRNMVSMGLFWIAPKRFLPLDSKTSDFLNADGKWTEGVKLKGKAKKWIVRNVDGETYFQLCAAVRNKLTEESNFQSGFAEFSYAAEQYAKDRNDLKAKKEEGDVMMENNETTSGTTKHPLNQILFGPPGTGKTYNTIVRAVEIIDGEDSVKNKTYDQIKERFVALKKHGRIDFVTFHQSYGYEDFIDGIKPVCDEMQEDDECEHSEIGYKRQAGVFRRFCLNAMQNDARLADGKLIPELGSEPRIWKVSLNGTGENKVRANCLKNGYIRVGFDDVGKFPEKSEIKKGRFVLRALYERMKVGDVVLSCYSHEEIDAIGVVTGKDVRWEDSFDECKRVRDVRWVWIAKPHKEKENIVAINLNKRFTLSTVYETKIQLSDVLKIIAKHLSKENANAEATINDQRYVFIIDEINRGNISKIFGELITLIEESKRVGNANELRVKLPNAEEGEADFGVPNNVYIIGTMNTADRSIAMLDTALRRRFEFVEMMPRPDLLNGIKILNAEGKDTGINIVRLLEVMNERIEVLLDREHQIGHAYFLEALKDHPTIDNLGKLFQNKIIPLLQEYFYDDYEKIRLVLGDENSELDFIKKISMNGDVSQKLFKSKEEIVDIIGDEKCVYRVNDDGVYKNPLAYRKIYDDVTLPGEKTN